jgi:hypothetical protein
LESEQHEAPHGGESEVFSVGGYRDQTTARSAAAATLYLSVLIDEGCAGWFLLGSRFKYHFLSFKY